MSVENLELQVAELDMRLKEMERHNRSWVLFFIQYLLSPLLVAGLAAGLNLYYQGKLEDQRKLLEEQRNEISQYELVNKMLPQLVHSSTKVAEATRLVLEHVINDAKLRNELNKVFQQNVLAQTMSELADAAPEQREKILRDTYRIVPQLEPELNQYEEALRLETQGFDALVAGEVDAAITAFEQLEQVYPQFHNTAEVVTLLRDNRARWDNPQVRQEVYRKVVEGLSWKAPQPQIEALRRRLQ